MHEPFKPTRSFSEWCAANPHPETLTIQRAIFERREFGDGFVHWWEWEQTGGPVPPPPWWLRGLTRETDHYRRFGTFERRRAA